MAEGAKGDKKNIRSVVKIIPFMLMVVVLVYISQRNYLFFHTAIELQSIVIAFTVFVLVLNSYDKVDNGYFIVLGISFGFVGILDFFHTVTYKGMNILSGYDADLPTQLWIISRYILSISIVLSFFYLNRKTSFKYVTTVYAGVSALALYVLFFTDWFPACFIEGEGLTVFKKASEYIISSIIALGIFLLYKNKEKFAGKVFGFLGLAFAANIGAELAFVFYVSVYGLSNMVGHILKLTAYYFIYKAVVETSFKSPMETLMFQLQNTINGLQEAQGALQNMSYLDGLTGIANRRKFDEYLEAEWGRAIRDRTAISLILGDIDSFKGFNDSYGHLKGDECIKTVAAVLKQSVKRPADLVARYGGEEFAVILPATDSDGALKVAENMRKDIEVLQIENIQALPYRCLTISLGVATFYPGVGSVPAEIVGAADKALYQAKREGRNRVVEYNQTN